MQRKGCLSHLSRGGGGIQRIQSAPTLYISSQEYDNLQGQTRADKLSKLKSTLLAQQNTFVHHAQLNQSSVRASFRVAQLIASSGKPFTDGEFVKKCLDAVAKEMCPEKKDVFH